MTDHGLRAAIDSGDIEAVRAIGEAHPDALGAELDWRENGRGDTSLPLNYVSLARFHNLTEHDRMPEITRVLIAAGAAVDGPPDTEETPLITAASYGEAGVAQALIEAGANLEAVGEAVDDATALGHAVYFGNAEVAELLVRAGAQIASLAEAAGSGDVSGRLAENSDDELAQALRAAAVCEQLEVMDQLLAAGVPVDAVTDHRTALQWAGYHGKATAARHLVEHGADPSATDAEHNATALAFARYRHRELHQPSPGHDQVEQYLEGLTSVSS